ncbi:MAG: SGNH/GDSL hydrolase family protein [Akkermansiaceae bacterium]|nr:SGNH/GDSL hydrolase family protein [Akkermansiaceae bacterium]
MKLTGKVLAILTMAMHVANAATYTDLAQPQCDTENKVIYDGKGSFKVESGAETSVTVKVNLNSLHSYVNSNDYKSGNPLMLWQTNAVAYGMADMANTEKPTGEREPELCFYWMGNVWQPQQKIDYATLQRYAVEGVVTLKLTNSQSNGVRVTAESAAGSDHEVLRAEGLKSAKIQNTNGYKVNLNYVTALTIDTRSTLDTEGYEPPKDYTQPFESKREDGSTLGRVMFMGDSITHGVNDQTWRWQLFKILVDNGIEADIVGPREGYTPGYTKLTTSDAGDNYGGVDFPNVHLAQSSGRTHNIICGSNEGMTGVNYGGHSTESSAATYNCDTWFCMMGTNDLLSDGGYTEENFCTKMQNMLGGTVSCTKGRYSRKANDEWGNLGQIANHVLSESTDKLYIMSVPCWGSHHNNNQPERHLTVKQYNGLLRSWTVQYRKKFGCNTEFVDINKGMVDYTHAVPYSWPDSMSNRAGRDGLHPNEQGSLIIAGNLAKALGIGGRTAGLPRSEGEGERWATRDDKKFFNLESGSKKFVAKGEFTEGGGYSVNIRATFGNGGTGGWQENDKALRIEVADGTNSGMLNLSEGCIMWGDMVLYCNKNSSPRNELRIVWHPGDETNNVPSGYYVWFNDMLIGQGLPATAANGTNGIRITADGNTGKVYNLSWTNKAYAPATEGTYNEQHAYKY